MPNNDDAMKKIANIYMERYSQELKDEMDSLAKAPGVAVAEVRLERRIRRWIAAKKRRPYYLGGLSALAACFILMFLFLLPGGLYVDNAPSMDPEAPGSTVSISPPFALTPSTPTGGFSISDGPHFDVIPLTATLPPGFTVAGFEQDYGKSIYYIDDVYRDNVVITLEMADMPPDTSGLVEINLGGLTAFGTQTDYYSLLTFNQDGILHTLTSRYDINTLIRLSEAFV